MVTEATLGAAAQAIEARHRRLARAAVVGLGLAAALGLLALYVGLMGLAQGWGYALRSLWADRLFVAAIAFGFGTQVGLYSYMRLGLHLPGGAPSSIVAASGTTSGAAMVACCLHHATDVLPLMGLSGAAIVAAQYREPLMALAVAMNLAGIVIMVRRLRHQRRMASTEPA